jgi:hypothetical protein
MSRKKKNFGEKKTVYRRLAKTRRLDTTRRRRSHLSILGAWCLLGTRPQEHRAQGALGAQVQAARLETRPAPGPKHKPKPTPSSTSRVVQTHAARLKTFDAPRSRPPPKAKSQEIKKYKDKATRIRVRVKRPTTPTPREVYSAPPQAEGQAKRPRTRSSSPRRKNTPHRISRKKEAARARVRQKPRYKERKPPKKKLRP